MRKLIVAGGAIVAAVVLAKRWASSGGLDFGQMIERMPDAPPKWMFRNITAIRENTDRILELVESERQHVGGA